MLTVSLGNLPGFLIGTKPHPNSKATGHPKINPLDSGPTTTSTPKSFACAAKSSIQALNASLSSNKGVTSLKIIPSFGNPGIDAICCLKIHNESSYTILLYHHKTMNNIKS